MDGVEPLYPVDFASVSLVGNLDFCPGPVRLFVWPDSCVSLVSRSYGFAVALCDADEHAREWALTLRRFQQALQAMRTEHLDDAYRELKGRAERAAKEARSNEALAE